MENTPVSLPKFFEQIVERVVERLIARRPEVFYFVDVLSPANNEYWRKLPSNGRGAMFNDAHVVDAVLARYADAGKIEPHPVWFSGWRVV